MRILSSAPTQLMRTVAVHRGGLVWPTQYNVTGPRPKKIQLTAEALNARARSPIHGGAVWNSVKGAWVALTGSKARGIAEGGYLKMLTRRGPREETLYFRTVIQGDKVHLFPAAVFETMPNSGRFICASLTANRSDLNLVNSLTLDTHARRRSEGIGEVTVATADTQPKPVTLWPHSVNGVEVTLSVDAQMYRVSFDPEVHTFVISMRERG